MNTNTPTLFITTGETMRQQWDEYSKVVPTTSPEYEMLWESWYQKTNTKHDDPNIVILKEFIEDTKKTKLCLENYTSKERATMHVLCDKIGLYHKSTGKKKTSRRLRITKPPVWLWDFTEPNPFVKRFQKDKPRMKTEAELLEKLAKFVCDFCDTTGKNANLFVSPYFGNTVVCEHCL